MRGFILHAFLFCQLVSTLSAQFIPMSMSPTKVDISLRQWRGPEQFQIYLTNTGPERTASITVQNAASSPWLVNLSQPKLMTPVSVAPFGFAVYPDRTTPGVHTATLVVSSTAGDQATFPVTINVEGPSFSVSPLAVTISGVEGKQELVGAVLTVKNNGPKINVGMSSDAPWFEFYGTGVFEAELTTTVGLNVTAQKLSAGVHRAKYTFSPEGLPPVSVDVTFNVAGLATSVTPSPLNLTVEAGKIASANVTVTTEAPLPLLTYGSSGWYWTEPRQITTSPSVVKVYADASKMGAGTAYGEIRFDDARVVTRARLPIVVTVTSAAPGGLEVTPSSVSLTASSAAAGTQRFQVMLTNRGAADSYTAATSAPWVRVTPASGALAANGMSILEIAADPSALPPGRHEATVSISVPGRPVVAIPVSLTIGTQGQASVTPASLALTATGMAASQDVTVSSPGVALQFACTAMNAWLRYSPESGSVPAGGTAAIHVWADPVTTPAGAQSSFLFVTTGGQTVSIPVTVSSSGGAQPLSVSPGSLTLSATAGGSAQPSAQATLNNPGAAVSFTASSSQNWLRVTPWSGQVASGGTATLTLQAQTQGMAAGTYNGQVTIAAGSQTLALGVTLTLTSAPALAVSPTAMEFTGLGSSQPARRTVAVKTQAGAAADFSFTVQSTGNWLLAEKSAGALSVGVNPLLLPSPRATGAIQITAVPPDGRVYTVQVTAEKAVAPTSWVLPQVADGGEFTTSITLVNDAAEAALASLKFHRSAGGEAHATEDWRPRISGGLPLGGIAIPPKSAVTFETAGGGTETVSGWAEVSGTQPLSGFAVFRQRREGGDQEAAVAMQAGLEDRIFIPYDNRAGMVTSFAAVNRDAEAALAVEYELRDEQGSTVGSGTLAELAPSGHLAARLIDVVPASRDRRGTMVLTAARAALAALALRFNPQGAFTSVAAVAQKGSAAATRQAFAQVADGGGFSTMLALVNAGPDTVRADVRFRRAIPGGGGETEPWTPALAGGGPLTGLLIPAGGTYFLETAGAGGTATSGWGEVESSAPLGGSAVFVYRGSSGVPQEASVELKSGAAGGFHLPFDNTGRFVTSVALANLDVTAPARIAVVIRDDSGTVVGEESLELPASGHLAFETGTRFAAMAGTRGSAQFTVQSGWVAAIGLRFSPAGPFTSFQPQYW